MSAHSEEAGDADRLWWIRPRVPGARRAHPTAAGSKNGVTRRQNILERPNSIFGNAGQWRGVRHVFNSKLML